MEEVAKIGQSQQQRVEKLTQTQSASHITHTHTYTRTKCTQAHHCFLIRQGPGTLKHALEWIKEDLVVKERSLQVDNQCLEVRKKLSEHPSTQQLPTLVTSNKGE